MRIEESGSELQEDFELDFETNKHSTWIQRIWRVTSNMTNTYRVGMWGNHTGDIDIWVIERKAEKGTHDAGNINNFE